MTRELDCPKCPFTPMEPVQLDDLELDECPKCGGRWYDLGELAKSAKEPQKFERACNGGLLKPRPGTAICPHCGDTMTNGGLVSEHLRVDYCQECGGFWLDKSEIRILEDLVQGE
ncbi:MAG: zf-TFIIB domain-containing protein [Elusimicrobia bacterium]|nr:zf-TFIIB domain-containing protein [Elusimicrobiota bacterium]